MANKIIIAEINKELGQIEIELESKREQLDDAENKHPQKALQLRLDISALTSRKEWLLKRKQLLGGEK